MALHSLMKRPYRSAFGCRKSPRVGLCRTGPTTGSSHSAICVRRSSRPLGSDVMSAAAARSASVHLPAPQSPFDGNTASSRPSVPLPKAMEPSAIVKICCQNWYPGRWTSRASMSAARREGADCPRNGCAAASSATTAHSKPRHVRTSLWGIGKQSTRRDRRNISFRAVSFRAMPFRTTSVRTTRLAFVLATVVLSAGTALLVNTVRAEDAAVTRERMVDLGRQHKTAEALYLALKEEARGGRRLTPLTTPDWSGVYTRARGGITFDPDQARGAPPTAKLT